MNSQTKPKWQRALGALAGEFSHLNVRLQLLSSSELFLPRRSAGHTRARLLNMAGFTIGVGTRVHGLPKITGGGTIMERLRIGRDCTIEGDCVLDLEEHITIEDGVNVGPGVMILTSTHELASAVHRAGPLMRSPVVIREGAWLRARCIILPGVTIGQGAIVEAGAVVNKDVAPNTRVGGSPATQLEQLQEHDQ